MAQKHPKAGKLGGSRYDIFKMSSRDRKRASYGRGAMDPLDPKNPKNVLWMFEEPKGKGTETAKE